MQKNLLDVLRITHIVAIPVIKSREHENKPLNNQYLYWRLRCQVKTEAVCKRSEIEEMSVKLIVRSVTGNFININRYVNRQLKRQQEVITK